MKDGLGSAGTAEVLGRMRWGREWEGTDKLGHVGGREGGPILPECRKKRDRQYQGCLLMEQREGSRRDFI